MGVYFGNDDPAKQAFEDIIPKIKKSMDYWKQFNLSKFAKARVIEIFHASRLWYAAKFYNLAPATTKEVGREFFNYINFPHANVTVSQIEMKKLREDGGIKLIDINIKIETSRIKWLMELVTNTQLQSHRNLITELLGRQKGGLRGTDIFFTTHHYAKKILSTKSHFYKEAIQAITKLHIKKKIEDPLQENIFYNPTFTNATLSVIATNITCEKNDICTYGQIRTEYVNMINRRPHRKHISNIYRRIRNKDLDDRTENVAFVKVGL